MTVALAALVLRLAAGSIFTVQGARKLFAARAAPHGRDALAAMIRGRGLPQPDRQAWLVAATEFVSGLGLFAGFLTRVVVLPLAGILVVAIVGFKWRAGFLGGWDWPFSVLAILSAIFVLGAGAWSVDALLHLPI
jgi:uncharacterized membrane protein YphA (DoxX/SURF4 family)